MGSPERRRKRRRSARARIGFRSSYVRGMRYFRRVPPLPHLAVMFSLFMMVSVCVRKSMMSAAKARSAELRAKARAARSPLAFLLEEQHEIHYQAAALSDPDNKCLAHTNGGHKQPVTFGVFTCVADARFLLRALIVSHGSRRMLVVDIGSPPVNDAGGITAGRAWDLRKTKQRKMNKRIKFREEPLPESSHLVLVEAHKSMSADDWTDVALSVMQLLTPDGAIVLMEHRRKSIPRDDRPGPGSAHLREALTQLACGEAGLAVGLAAFDEGLAVVRRAGEDLGRLSRLERGCILDEDLEDEIIDENQADDSNDDYAASSASDAASAASTATGAASAAAGTASAATGPSSTSAGAASAAISAASAATGPASAAAGSASAGMGAAPAATGPASASAGSASAAIGAESAATGPASASAGSASAAMGAAPASTGPASAAAGSASAATGPASASAGSASAATGPASASAGSAPAAIGAASAAAGSASAATGPASASAGSAAAGSASAAASAASVATGASAATGPASASAGSASAAASAASVATGTAESAANGTASVAMNNSSFAMSNSSFAMSNSSFAMGNSSFTTGTVAAGPTQPLLRFEEMLSFAMGKAWTPEAVQTRFGGADAVRKYAHRAGSRLFCVKNLARDSEGTGTKKQTPSGDGGGSGNLRSSKRNDGIELDPTPEQKARVCLEKHMQKHPNDVRGAFVLEMVLQSGGGADGVDVDQQIARLREDAVNERGEAGLSLWKALHARGASAGAKGLLLP